MSRLPNVGGDDNTWGNVLNDFLGVEHNADGSQKTLSISKGGTGATDAATARGNIGAVSSTDARLSDARAPTAHRASHASGGSDALAPSDIGAIAKGELVFNVKDYGATTASLSAGLQAAYNAAFAAGGGDVVIPNGTWTLDSASLLLTRNNSGTPVPVRVRGMGKTIVKLTAAAPSFTKFNSLAVGDTFRDICIEDLLIDANNVNAVAHVILGTYTDNVNYANFQDISVRRVRAYNLPVDPTHAAGNMVGIYLRLRQSVWNDAHAVQAVRILFEDVTVDGGNYGIFVGGQVDAGGSGAGTMYLDQIRAVRCRHTMGNAAPTASQPNNNFQFGSHCYGGVLLVEDCVGENATDTGYEVNGFQKADLVGCVARNANNYSFLSKQFNSKLDASDQNITLTRCRGEATTLHPGAAGQNNTFLGILNDTGTSAGIATGNITLRDCSQYVASRTRLVTFGSMISTDNNLPIHSLTVDGFTIEEPADTLSTTVADSPVLAAMRFTSYGPVTFRSLRVRIAGSVAGGGNVQLTGLYLNGSNGAGGPIPFLFEDISWDVNVAAGTLLGFFPIDVGEIAGSVLAGTVRRQVIPRSPATSTYGFTCGGSGTLTIPTRIAVIDCDYTNTTARAAPGAGNEGKVWFDSGKIAAAPAGTWVSYGAPLEPLAYEKTSAGLVILHGVGKNGAAASQIFTLPAGYRPGNTVSFAPMIYTGAAYAAGEVQVTAVGVVSIFGNSAGVGNYSSIEGMVFDVAA